FTATTTRCTARRGCFGSSPMPSRPSRRRCPTCPSWSPRRRFGSRCPRRSSSASWTALSSISAPSTTGSTWMGGGCSLATAGDSSARRTRSRSSSPGTRPRTSNGSPRSVARWRDGCARRAFTSEMTTRRWFVAVLAAVAILLLAGRALSAIYADYQWYEALGAGALWRLRAGAVAAIDAGAFAATALFAYANFHAVRQSVVSLVFPRRVGNLEIGEEVPGKYLIAAAAILAILIGLLLLPSGDSWTSAILARSGQLFGEPEPNFRADLGFFVYWLPFENTLWDWAFVGVAVIGLAVILLYALTPSLRFQRGTVHMTGYVKRHLTVLAGVLLLLAAWSFRLDMYALVTSGTGPEGLFGFVDDKVGVTGDLVLALATLGAAAVVIWGGFAGQFRLAGVAVLTVGLLGLLVPQGAPVSVAHLGTPTYR